MKILVTLLAVFFVFGTRADVFNVRDFGAKGDGQTLDTVAIQKALDKCTNAGGGTVTFPPGTYLSQPITLRGSHTTLELDAGATLQATTNQSDFMKTPGDWLKVANSGQFVPFIGGKNLADITFCGGGTIDGSGAVWWGEAEKARERVPGFTLPRPDLIVLQRCPNVFMRNITLRNSPKYHFVPDECNGLVVSNVTILAPESAANTDGIDPGNCENVLITKCRIDTGDDNIAIKAGRKIKGREFACDNITITDCAFLHGHGMSIGSETSGGVHHVVVKNCTFENTDNGIRIKSQRGKGGLVEDIVYQDIKMKNVDPAITFTSYYMYNSAHDAVKKTAPQNDAARAMTATTPVYRDIRVSHLTATCQESAGVITGLPESVISDVVFDDVNISAASGMKIENASGIQFKDSKVTVGQGQPLILKNAQVEGLAGSTGQ